MKKINWLNVLKAMALMVLGYFVIIGTQWLARHTNEGMHIFDIRTFGTTGTEE